MATKITFFDAELRVAPDPAFLSGFSSARARVTAEKLLLWAKRKGYGLRPGDGRKDLTEYIVRRPKAPNRQGVPLLTLEQGKPLVKEQVGGVHVPFSRWRELSLTDARSERILFDEMNLVLGADHAMGAEHLRPGLNLKNWAPISYLAFERQAEFDAFTKILADFADQCE